MESPTPKRRRRWFSISLRGLMLLILVLGGLMGWKARRASLQRRAVARIEQLKGTVVYDWQYTGYISITKPGASPSGPVWLRKILGDEYFQEVTQVALPAQFSKPNVAADDDTDFFEKQAKIDLAYQQLVVQPIEDDQLACLDHLDRLESLVLSTRFPLKAEGLARLERLDRLKVLSLSRNLDADGLKWLERLTNLENLNVQFEESGNTDLTFLDKMPRLKSLTIGSDSVTDAHMKKIGQLRDLESLSLSGQELTDEGLSQLQSSVQLKTLSIILPTSLTGRGLVSLDRLTNLVMLQLPGLPMNKEGTRRDWTIFVNCQI